MTKNILPFIFLIILCNNIIVASSSCIGDTIRYKKEEKPQKLFPSQPLYLLKTNPFAILWGPIPFTAEYKLIVESPINRTQSVQAGMSYLGKSPAIWIAEKQQNGQFDPYLVIKGFRVQASYRFYWIRKKYAAPYGFFISPNISYSKAQIAIGKIRALKQEHYNISHYNINLLFGVQVGRNKKISAEIFGGIGYKKNLWNYQYSPLRTAKVDISELGTYYNSNFKLTLGFTVGYAIY